MTMRVKLLVMMILVAVLAVPAGSAGAQDVSGLIIFSERDLWRFENGELINLTNNGHVLLYPALSPDGTAIAYEHWAPMTVAALEKSEGHAWDEMPSDISVVDLRTGEITIIAAQPDDAAFLSPNLNDHTGITRSNPTWSPDGTKIAWAEAYYSQAISRLMVADLVSGEVRTLVVSIPTIGFPPTTGVKPLPAIVKWGGAGLALYSCPWDDINDRRIIQITVYDETGTFLSSFNESFINDHFMWLENHQIAVFDLIGETWHILDPLTGTFETALGQPEMVSAADADQSTGITFTYHPTRYSYSMTIHYPDQSSLERPTDDYDHRVTLSPDGQTAVVSYRGEAILYHDNIEQRIELPGESPVIYWGTVKWRLVPDNSAVQERPPLQIVTQYAGDLWLIDQNGIVNLTNDGTVNGVALSPDRKRIAYRCLAPLSQDARAKGVSLDDQIDWPTDIRVISLETFNISTIGEQPPRPVLVGDPAQDNAVLRSFPSWSPDGTQLAWTEIHYPSFAPERNRLMTYNFTNGETRILASSLPGTSGRPYAHHPYWGGGGLAMQIVGPPIEGSWPEVQILIYSEEGALLTTTLIPNDDEHVLNTFRWVNNNGQDQIAVQYLSHAWDVIDPLTGKLQPSPAEPELYNPFIPESAAVRLAADSSREWPDLYRWTLTRPNRQQVISEQWLSSERAITLAPDGQTLAVLNSDGTIDVYWPDGIVTRVAALTTGTSSLLWGPTEWRIPSECSDLRPRLNQASSARVLTEPLNFYSHPVTGDVIDQIPSGATFGVLIGPSCSGGIYWWQASYNGTIGWIAESDGSSYLVEPVVLEG